MLCYVTEVKYILRLCSQPKQIRWEDTQQHNSTSVTDLSNISTGEKQFSRANGSHLMLATLSFLFVLFVFILAFLENTEGIYHME